jgi:hypothetical protein
MQRKPRATKKKALAEAPVEMMPAVDAPVEVSAEAPVEPPPAPVVEDYTPPKMGAEELRSLLSAEMQSQIEKLKAENARLSKMYLLSKLDPKGLISAQEDKIAAAEKAARLQMEKYRRVVQEACKRFGMDPVKTSYDPDTGILRELE